MANSGTPTRSAQGRRGHASGDLRDAFLSAVEAFLRAPAELPGSAVEPREDQRSLSALCDLLWNCSDVLPRAERQAIADHFGDQVAEPSTYAAAARLLRPMAVEVEGRNPPPAEVSLMRPEMTLRELRKASGMKQAKLAAATGYPVGRISGMEAMTDMRLSTLDRLVHGLGGRLRLMVDFQDQASVVLSNLGTPNAPNSQARYNANQRGSKRSSPARQYVTRDPRLQASGATPAEPAGLDAPETAAGPARP